MLSIAGLAIALFIGFLTVYAGTLKSDPDRQRQWLTNQFIAFIMVGALTTTYLLFQFDYRGAAVGVSAAIAIGYSVMYVLGEGPAKRVDTVLLCFAVAYMVFIAMSAFIVDTFELLRTLAAAIRALQQK